MADAPTNQGENHVQQVRPEVATVGGRQPLESDWHYSSAHIAHVLGDSARPIEGDFQGDNNALVSNIVALLGLDKDGALVPHGIGGHARCLLAAAAVRLSATPSPPVAAAPATPVAPTGWVTMWPTPRMPGYEPVYTHGSKKPSYGPELDALLDVQPVYAAAQPQPQPAQPLTGTAAKVRAPLSDAQIEKLREATFSTNNPFCPCDSRTMRKAVWAAERAHGITAPSTPTPPEVAP